MYFQHFLFQLLQSVTALTILSRPAFGLLSQDTIYDYNNKTLYIHLYNYNLNQTLEDDYTLNKLFRIPFNSKLSSSHVLNSTISPPPQEMCKVVVAESILYSFCPTDNELLGINKYTSTNDSWNSLDLKSNIKYFNDSSYLFTDSDPSGIYIFSGLSETGLSDQMIRLDLQTLETENATSQVQPSPFYESTTLQINSNTVGLFGGVSYNNELVSMMEIPVWQYNGWAERPCNISNSQEVGSRIGALILPVFSQSNEYLLNQTISDFQVSSVFMMGGKDLNNDDAYPSFASLNVSKNVWQWQDLSDDLILANNENNKTGVEISLEGILAAGIIYDTLITITDPNISSQSLFKRDNLNFDNLKINLYNVTTLDYLPYVDYTYLNSISEYKKITTHSNKNVTIALSVIIPILVIIILACFLVWLYKKYKTKKEEEQHDKEIKEIVDFYEHQHKQHSDLTFSSYDSTYKSGESSNYNNAKTITYNEGDNSSIESWRKKRDDFEKQKDLFDIAKPNFEFMVKSRSSSLSRTLSVASHFISQSLKRNNSTQSSIATFFTARTKVSKGEFGNGVVDNFDIINENPFQSEFGEKNSSSEFVQSPPPAIPKHKTLITFPNRTSSTLNHIPEDGSLITFHSQTLGFIPMKQAYNNNGAITNSPQRNYMKHISQNPSHSSYDSSTTASSNSYSHTPRSPRRPLSMYSTSSVLTSPNSCYNSNLLTRDNENNEYMINNTGYTSDEDLDNLEVQVLVGSKRRSKLRVVNPDRVEEEEEEIEKEEDEEEVAGEKRIQTIEPKNRCSSSGSEQSKDSNVRKRVISEEHDESFI